MFILIPFCLKTCKPLLQQLCFKKIKLPLKMEIRPIGRHAYFGSFYWHLKGSVSENICMHFSNSYPFYVHNLKYLILSQMHICHLQKSFWIFSPSCYDNQCFYKSFLNQMSFVSHVISTEFSFLAYFHYGVYVIETNSPEQKHGVSISIRSQSVSPWHHIFKINLDGRQCLIDGLLTV